MIPVSSAWLLSMWLGCSADHAASLSMWRCSSRMPAGNALSGIVVVSSSGNAGGPSACFASACRRGCVPAGDALSGIVVVSNNGRAYIYALEHTHTHTHLCMHSWQFEHAPVPSRDTTFRAPSECWHAPDQPDIPMLTTGRHVAMKLLLAHRVVRASQPRVNAACCEVHVPALWSHSRSASSTLACLHNRAVSTSLLFCKLPRGGAVLLVQHPSAYELVTAEMTWFRVGTSDSSVGTEKAPIASRPAHADLPVERRHGSQAGQALRGT